MSTTTMSEWWSALSLWQQLYWGIAVFFSLLFLLQYIGALLGLAVDTEMEGGVDLDQTIDPGFTWLSMRSIVAFFTFFGWTGVVLLSRGAALWWTVTVSFFCGMLAMSVVVYLLYLFARQTQAGNYRIADALYQTGEIYLPVPPARSGTGKIHVRIGQALRELTVQTDGPSLPTGALARVVEVLDDQTLLVAADTPLPDRSTDSPNPES